MTRDQHREMGERVGRLAGKALFLIACIFIGASLALWWA